MIYLVLTLEAWVKPDNLDAEFQSVFAKSYSHNSENWAYGIYKMGSDPLVSLASYPTGLTEAEWWSTQQDIAISSANLLDNEWHHLAYVVNTTDRTFSSYLDGFICLS